jgi:hypothetical protein
MLGLAIDLKKYATIILGGYRQISVGMYVPNRSRKRWERIAMSGDGPDAAAQCGYSMKLPMRLLT